MTSSEQSIQNLIARYAFLVDHGDFARLGELFADADFALGSSSVYGAEAVAELAGRVLQTHDGGTPRTRHVTTNIVLDVDVDVETGTAQVHAYFTVSQQVDAFPLQPIATGRYRDTFIRRGGIEPRHPTSAAAEHVTNYKTRPSGRPHVRGVARVTPER